MYSRFRSAEQGGLFASLRLNPKRRRLRLEPFTFQSRFCWVLSLRNLYVFEVLESMRPSTVCLCLPMSQEAQLRQEAGEEAQEEGEIPASE